MCRFFTAHHTNKEILEVGIVVKKFFFNFSSYGNFVFPTQMSYYGPGSIYSIGLHNVAGMCLLLSIGSGVSIVALWGRIEGTLGDIEDSLSATLYKVR